MLKGCHYGRPVLVTAQLPNQFPQMKIALRCKMKVIRISKILTSTVASDGF